MKKDIRRNKKGGPLRTSFHVTIGVDTAEWVDEIVGKRKTHLRNRSHAVEWALLELRKQMEAEQGKK